MKTIYTGYNPRTYLVESSETDSWWVGAKQVSNINGETYHIKTLTFDKSLHNVHGQSKEYLLRRDLEWGWRKVTVEQYNTYLNYLTNNNNHLFHHLQRIINGN